MNEDKPSDNVRVCYNVSMNVMNRLPVKIIIGIVTVALACLSATSAPPKQTAFEEKAFIAGPDPQVQIYQMNEQGGMEAAKTLPRGTEVMLRDEDSKEMDGVEYKRIYLEEDESAEALFIKPGSLVNHKTDVVQERELYVRTPVTLYQSSEGPEIAGFAPKGTKLEVIGFAGLREDGSVSKYKVRVAADDSEGGEAAPEGFAYSKYLVRTQEAADAPYNENGEYDKAKKAKYDINLHGGSAADLDYYPYERTTIKGKEFCREAKAMYLNYLAVIDNDAYIKLIQ